MTLRWTARIALATSLSLAACSDLLGLEAEDRNDVDEEPDAGATDASTTPPAPDASDPDRPDAPGPSDPDAASPTPTACRVLPLDCLDPSPANVIEVPSEATLAEAFASARADDTVQIRASAVTEAVAVPERITLRGCSGAQLAGAVSFAGGSATLEGFLVSGSIRVARSGSFVIRHDRFVPDPEATGVPAVLAEATDSSSNAIVLLVDANRFEGRKLGIQLRTVGGLGLQATLQNNVFAGVQKPTLVAQPSDVTPPVIVHDTFFDFGTAIGIQSGGAFTAANLFVRGSIGIESNGGEFQAHDSMAWQVTDPFFTPPTAGVVETVDPQLTAPEAGDFTLSAGSPALDRVTPSNRTPAEDLAGCARPAGASPPLRADLGALERQP